MGGSSLLVHVLLYVTCVCDTVIHVLYYMLCSKYMYGSGQSVDFLAQSMDPQFVQ